MATKAKTVKTVYFADVVKHIASIKGLSRSSADDALSAALGFIMKTVSIGGIVKIKGFGVFKKSPRVARMGVNPRNPSEKISLPAMDVPVFRAGKTFKESVR